MSGIALRARRTRATPQVTTPQTGPDRWFAIGRPKQGAKRNIVTEARFSGRMDMECAEMTAVSKTLIFTPSLLLASPALAHPGHIADLAGHDHWVAGAAIGAAIAAAIWGHLKGKKSEPEEDIEDTDPEEATA